MPYSLDPHQVSPVTTPTPTRTTSPRNTNLHNCPLRPPHPADAHPPRFRTPTHGSPTSLRRHSSLEQDLIRALDRALLMLRRMGGAGLRVHGIILASREIPGQRTCRRAWGEDMRRVVANLRYPLRWEGMVTLFSFRGRGRIRVREVEEDIPSISSRNMCRLDRALGGPKVSFSFSVLLLTSGLWFGRLRFIFVSSRWPTEVSLLRRSWS